MMLFAKFKSAVLGILLLLGFTSLSSTAYAQQAALDLPELRLYKAEDYPKYEKDVLSAINWMTSTPVDENPGQRKEAEKFLFTWVSGSPDVSVVIDPRIIDLSNDGHLLLVYIGGWAKNAIENPKADKEENLTAALNTTLEFYQNNKEALGKNKATEKLLKLKEKGKFEEHVQKFSK